MADRADGSLRFDTSLDTKGFEKGSKELLSAIKSLTQEVQRLGQFLTGSTGDFNRKAEESAESTEELKTEVKETAEAAEKLEAEIKETAEAVDESQDALTKFTAGLEVLKDSVSDLSKVKDKALDGDSSALSETESGVERLTDRVAELRKLLDDTGLNDSTKDIYSGTLDGYAETIDRIRESLENYKNAADDVAKEPPVGAKTAKTLGDVSEKAGSVAGKLRAILGEGGKVAGVIEKVGTGAASVASKLAALTGPELAAAVLALGLVAKAIEAVGAKLKAIVANVKSGSKAFKELPTRAEETKSRMQKAFGFIASAVMHPIKSLQKLDYQFDQLTRKAMGAIGTRILDSFRNLGTAAKDAAKNLAEMARQKVINGIQKTVGSVVGLGKTLASVAGSAVKSGLSNVVSKIKSLGKSAISSGLGMKQLLSATLGVSGVSSLFTKAIDAAKDGMAGLAQKNQQFNKSMSNFITACNQLKGALASAFAPIANVVLPLLTKLIGYVTQAANAVGMLLAALTGQKTFTKATAVQADYAANVDKSATKTKKLAKETEKLKRQLMGFDDVNILQKDKDSDSDDAAGGYNPSDYGYDFKEVPIESNIAKLAERIKAAWEKGDFYDLGRELGEAIKEGLESIPWSKIQKLANKAGKSLATFLNGLQETPGLANAAGEALGELVNTIFQFLNGFGANYNWSTLGQFIREGLMGMLNAIDWKLIYETARVYGAGIGRAIEAAFDDETLWAAIFTSLAKGLNSIVYFLVAFLEAVDWGGIYHSMATGLNDGIEAIDWDALARMLVDAFNGLFDAAYEFVTTFDFGKFGTHIGETLNTVIEGVDWSRAFMAMGAFVTGLFTSLLRFLQEVDWLQVGTTIATSINSAILTTDWSLIGETLKSAFNAIIKTFFGFVRDFDFSEFGKSLGDLINNAIIGIDVEKFFESIALLINGIFQALLSSLNELDWAQMAIDLANGLNAGIRAVDVETITDSISTLINSLLTLFLNFVSTFDWLSFGMLIGQSIGDTLEKIDWENFAKGVGEFINGLFKSLKGFVAAIDWTQLVMDIVNFMLELFETLDWAEFGSTINLFIRSLFDALEMLMESEQWDEIVEVITDAFDTFLQQFDWVDLVSRAVAIFVKAWNQYTDTKNELYSEVLAVGGQVIKGLLKGIVDNLSDVHTWIKNNVFAKITGGIKSVFGIHSPAEEMKPLGENITSGMLEGVKSPMSTISNWLSEHVKNPFVNKLRSIFGTKNSSSAMAKEGKELTEDLKDGADKGWKAVDNVFESGVKNIVNKIKQTNWKSLGSNITDSIKSGIKFNNIESAMRNGATSAQNAFKNAVSWYNVGYYIVSGICDGLNRNSRYISDAAYYAAVNAYNAACNALGIASPSKKFIWIAEMMLTGLRNGILDNEGMAVKAISGVAQNLVGAAEDESPIMKLQIQSAVDGLDDVMHQFSDKIVNGFADMMSKLEAIASGSGFTIPAVARGTLSPYAPRVGTSPGVMASSNEDVIEAIQHLESSVVRRDELRPLLEDIARRYQAQFWIGDEQIARHANSGNEMLGLRYRTT